MSNSPDKPNEQEVAASQEDLVIMQFLKFIEKCCPHSAAQIGYPESETNTLGGRYHYQHTASSNSITKPPIEIVCMYTPPNINERHPYASISYETAALHPDGTKSSTHIEELFYNHGNIIHNTPDQQEYLNLNDIKHRQLVELHIKERTAEMIAEELTLIDPIENRQV